MEWIFNPDLSEVKEKIKRPTIQTENLNAIVEEIFEAVKSKGDKAIFEYTEKFDKAKLKSLKVSSEEISESYNLVSQEIKEAIKVAKNNIQKFHSSQKEEVKKIETTKGVFCWRKSIPIDSVGLYIPGGTAPLFSAALMLGVPAKLAGCKEINLFTPPNSEGKIAPEILYTASLIGIEKIFKVGGIQAVAGMSLGTETIPKVLKIFGPGNQFVTAAKVHALSLGINIDMPAGPSEVLVIAGENANAKFVASDLLSQAEHGIDSQVVVIGTSEEFLKETEKEILSYTEILPRKEIIKKALTHAKFVLVKTEEEAIEVSNIYAPEHLIIASENAEDLAEKVINAGSVFIGNYTPESAGDYASGTNHTLPTNGFATSWSAVSLDSFYKKVTFQSITKEGMKNLGTTISLMAEKEGLEAHSLAVKVRLEDLNS